MNYTSRYKSPVGEIMMACDEDDALTGLWFEGQKYYASTLDKEHEERETAVIMETKRWLDIYFSGKEPDFTPKMRLRSTPFRELVWEALKRIPYGETRTYKEIAQEAAERMGRERMSAQAVGGAVGHNPISIIIPCHRVISADGGLTGYAGGVEKKEKLIEMEKRGREKRGRE